MDDNEVLAHWGEAARAVDWYRAPETVLDDSAAPFYRWFSDGRCNTCYNALDRHVAAGNGERLALIYDSPVTDTVAYFSYRELRDRVAAFAGGLRQLGVGPGDRVVIYMPMVPEAVIAMLACARLGAVHSVVFGGFAASELAARIDDCRARVVLSASCGIEHARIIDYKPLLDAAIDACEHPPAHCVVLQREAQQATLVADRDLDWERVATGAEPADCVALAATDPLYLLYTSGTTGSPKGVVRDNGGHMVALVWSMAHIYGIDPGDVFWAASDIGWVVGHSYIVYGPLLRGATSVLFEGKPVGTPDASSYWRLIDRHRVKVLFTAPTAIRAIKQQDPAGQGAADFDLSSLRYLFLAGERADPNTLIWAEEVLNVPVIDHWWQTELGWPAIANFAGDAFFPVRHGSSGKAVPGFAIEVLDGRGEPVPRGEMGALVIRLPLPPGALTTLWHNDEGFREKYLSRFPGYYDAGDAGFIDADGYIHVMARTDDVINVAGHRLSTGRLEEVIAGHPDVAECAVFGVSDPLKGQVPLGLLVLNAGVERDPETLVAEVVERVRSEVGPVAAFRDARVVARLPKTRSGKILRATLQQMAEGRDYRVPGTIDDPAILEELAPVLAMNDGR